jgi:uncharacterized membrane protein
MGLVVFLVLLVLAAGGVTWVVKAGQRRELEKKAAELEPVKKLAYEDVTALGEALQELDLDLTGHELSPGANADYQRALDSYEAAKTAADAMSRPDDVKHVTEILEDARYAMTCVRARVEGTELPARRPPCFFDPRHGTSVIDVAYTPPGGTERDVPACALDLERVRAGAEPDIRKVLVGSQRVPYWQGGRAYQPYARGYFGGFGPMDWMFMGFMFEGLGGGLGGLGEGLGEGIGGLVGGIGDGLGDVLGGIGDGIGGIFDGIGDMFDGFDL